MREIKFRGRDKYKHWHYGGLYINDDAKYAAILKNRWINVEVDYKTVGQFTGLKDSNGKEIYEGDIVASDSGRLRDPVRWDAKRAVYVIGKTLVLGDFYKLVRVIGNVNDNPELLEAAEWMGVISWKSFRG